VGGAGTTWWGEFPVGRSDVRFWQVGPLRLWITRSDGEWRLAFLGGDDSMDATLDVNEPVREEDVDPAAAVVRFGFRKPGESVRILPALPDRHLVVNPVTPFYVPSGERITLYVSAPLWMSLWAGDPRRKIREIPTFRPTDTWFGPSTRVGEVCYASKTGARMELESLPRRPHRAVVVVTVINRAVSQLPLEKLKLPMPNLSLFASEDGRLWTEGITLTRQEDGEQAAVTLDADPPAQAGDAVRVGDARLRVERGHLIRAFGHILDFM